MLLECIKPFRKLMALILPIILKKSVSREALVPYFQSTKDPKNLGKIISVAKYFK